MKVVLYAVRVSKKPNHASWKCLTNSILRVSQASQDSFLLFSLSFMQQSPPSSLKSAMSLKRNAKDYAWSDGDVMASNKRPRWNPPSEWPSYETLAAPVAAFRPLRTTSTVISDESSTSVAAPSKPPVEEEDIITPHTNDVLCGRGGHAIRHHGNIRFRMVVDHNKTLYQTCKKERKILVAQSVVEAIYRQEPPGRFLEHNKKTGVWTIIDKKKAIHKTSQALREGAKELRKKLQQEDANSISSHTSHEDDSGKHGKDEEDRDSDDESQQEEPRPSHPEEDSSGGRHYSSEYQNNCRQESAALGVPLRAYSSSFSSAIEWIPSNFTSLDEVADASVVSDEELEELFSSPPPPPVPYPMRETSLDKFDFTPLEDAQYLDALLLDEQSVIAA